MLIDLSDILAAYGKTPTGVIHCGAHEGQEAIAYRAARINHVVWIEANPALIPILSKHVRRFDHLVVEACLGATTGETVTFHIAEADNMSNKGQSSSLLELGTHKIAHPEVSFVKDLTLVTMTLDDLMIRDASCLVPSGAMLNLDLQGAELIALAGAEHTIEHIDLIVSEVNCDELYQNCALLPQYDEWLVAHGFEIQQVKLAGCMRRDCSDGGNRWVGWGDMVAWHVDDPRPFTETHPEDAADWYQ